MNYTLSVLCILCLGHSALINNTMNIELINQLIFIKLFPAIEITSVLQVLTNYQSILHALAKHEDIRI